MHQVYLGIDVGSVSTKFAVVDVDGGVVDSIYLRTDGQPIRAIQQGLEAIEERMDPLSVIDGVGATGSARRLAGVLAGADVIRNEITAHSVAALRFVPDVRTIIEIGGQDSKLIIVRDGVVTDFAMNTVCAAGTGSFLDHQASRLGVPISEFGSMALSAKHPVRIAGRCGVFAESDMIHKQQAGYATEDIVAGLCEALVRNYLNNVARGKRIEGPVVFQGGVAANLGIRAAFERSLEQPVIVPQRYEVMGAIGAAYLAQETAHMRAATAFRGFQISQANCRTTAFDCQGCPNLCEVVEVRLEGEVLARWGDRCGKWSQGELANGAV
jgi:predicted CoA-substrate-specific enzyme activase